MFPLFPLSYSIDENIHMYAPRYLYDPQPQEVCQWRKAQVGCPSEGKTGYLSVRSARGRTSTALPEDVRFKSEWIKHDTLSEGKKNHNHHNNHATTAVHDSEYTSSF